MTTADPAARPRARTDPLGPVRAALMASAGADAARVLARADADVAERLAAAGVEAARVRESAAEDVALEVDTIAAEARVRARRQERAIVLAAQRAAYEQLRAGARAAVRGLRGDTAYQPLLERLGAVARERLGPGAVVREHPDGGVVAEVAGRRLSLTLDAAAERAVDALGRDVERLWTP